MLIAVISTQACRFLVRGTSHGTTEAHLMSNIIKEILSKFEKQNAVIILLYHNIFISVFIYMHVRESPSMYMLPQVQILTQT